MKVAFLHPDLGIGGAERLVVDCAVALKQLGNDVTIYTSYYDPSHCFDETKDLRVEVLGNSVFPRNVFGKFSILCSILRQLHLTKQLISKRADIDLFVVDQLSAAVPYLRTNFPKARILFYCHHPDLLLTSRDSVLKKAYRLPFDKFEKWSTLLSDVIVVNSEYTRHVFNDTFGPSRDPSVLYPVVAPFTPVDVSTVKMQEVVSVLSPYVCQERPKLFLSINRFERKKDIELAISAFSLLLHMHEEYRDCMLIIAGGYDDRVNENKEYLHELESLAKKFRIPYETLFPSESWNTLKPEKFRILFLPSVSSTIKQYLLESADMLVYTPTNEHFGIVPLEAMQTGTPVLATNTGGPLETIVDGETGWLRAPDMEVWFKVLQKFVSQTSRQQIEEMGKNGQRRVKEKFSFEQLKDNLNKLASKTIETERKDEASLPAHVRNVTLLIILFFFLLGAVAVALLILIREIYLVTLKL